ALRSESLLDGFDRVQRRGRGGGRLGVGHFCQLQLLSQGDLTRRTASRPSEFRGGGQPRWRSPRESARSNILPSLQRWASALDLLAPLLAQALPLRYRRGCFALIGFWQKRCLGASRHEKVPSVAG